MLHFVDHGWPCWSLTSPQNRSPISGVERIFAHALVPITIFPLSETRKGASRFSNGWQAAAATADAER